MKEKKGISRKKFLKHSVVGLIGTSVIGNLIPSKSFGVPFPGSVLGANDRINMGFIGVGNRGSQLLQLFMQEKSCSIGGLCDVYKPYLNRERKAVDSRILAFCKAVPAMNESFDKSPRKYGDYRRLLENKDIDAVCIATPDHWHALNTIDAMGAGKDIYVEKPLTATIAEGRRMVDSQRATNRVVAVGLNRRGCPVYQRLAKDIPAGKIGKVTVAAAARVNNMFPNGIGNFKPERVPEGLDWNMWLGPRGYREWQVNVAPYFFRWWNDYSSQMGNWGVHYLDVIRWMLGEQAPVTIHAIGGKYLLTDDREIPDTMQVVFEFGSGAIANFSIFEATSGGLFRDGEVELRGTRGILNASESHYSIRPTSPGQGQNWKDQPLPAVEEFKLKDNKELGDGSNSNSTQVLVRNFLDCVKTRNQPLCPLEEGHRSTSFAHLANIALATGVRLEWDAQAERFKNNAQANEMLDYTYRAPWKNHQ